MEPTNDNFDFMKLMNIKGNIENITPHKIAVVAFIREYGLLKLEAKDMVDCTMAPKYRKDFCILALKLIQCPDIEFKDLEILLTDGKYNLLSVHLQNFCVRLQNIYVNGISALMDCVTTTVDKLMNGQNETNPCIITRNSVLGFYLRRIVLHLDKLTFVQVVSLYKSFCSYYQRGRPGLMMRSLSKEKLNNMEQLASSTSAAFPDESKPHELSIRMNIIERDTSFEECQWSRKQAELFTAQQANLLQVNEKMALPAKQLQKTIIQVTKDIPEYSDIHFLSFMNCIRMKEFCGAQDSLYNCFDRTLFSASGSATNGNGNGGEKNKNYRYAALNRAAMHTHFGHKEVAMESVTEALAVAQEAGEAGGLGHAVAWGAVSGGMGKRAALLDSSFSKTTNTGNAGSPRVPRAHAATTQLLAKHKALSSTRPSEVFQIITQGDSINYLHSMTDLTMAGLANTAALWSLYGKTEMASVSCQLLLNLNTKQHIGSNRVWHWSEASATCAAGLVAVSAWRGAPALPALLCHHARSMHALHATHYIRSGKWEDADQSIRQLASFDRWESQLLRAEMYFLKGDPTAALECLYDILDFCKTQDDSVYHESLKLKAMIQIAEVQHTFSNIQSSNIIMLNEVLAMAKKAHMHYLAATAELHIANVQLHMGCAKNALCLVRKVLPCVMAHGSAYDMARGLLLYTKCRVACAPPSGEARTQLIQSCCDALESVKKNFSKVDAQARLLQTWYLQAQLYNEIGNHAARNQCAWMYRQLETQNPVELSNILHIMY